MIDKTNNKSSSVDAVSQKIQSILNKRNNRTRVISIRFNPIVLLIVSFVIIFLLVNFSNNGVKEKLTLNEAIRGIKDNLYSQVYLQNDGNIAIYSKNILFTKVQNEQDKKQIPGSLNLKEINEKEFFEIVFNQNVFNQIRSIFSISDTYLNFVISELIVGNDYLLLLPANRNQKFGYILSSVSNPYHILKTRANDKGIKLTSLPFKILRLDVYSEQVQYTSFMSRVKANQFSKVFVNQDYFYGILKENFVNQYYINWNSNFASFISTLQSEGVVIENLAVEINPLNVPPGLTFDDVLTILSLLGFIFIGYIIFRGAQSTGMGITQFGQSRAKIFFGSRTDTTFKDVAGIDEAKEELDEIVQFLKDPMKFRRLGARIPKGVLMVGPPGTGKTLLARAIAGEAGVPFFHTSGSEFEEMLVGAGASRVRDLFAKAKKAAPSLVFIDEIDAVARKRGTKIQSSTNEQTLNQILVEMDGFEKNTNVIVLAATNRPDVLDPAILRPGRFDRQIRIELPDMDGRYKILLVHSRNKPLSSDVDLEKIAKRTVGFTGADLENILNEAAILAAKHDKKMIEMSDIEEAVSKVVLGPAKRSRKRTEQELKLVAYHEAGHAIVSYFTPEADPVDKISIISRGSSGGVTMFIPEKDEYILSKRKIVAKIIVALGGRAAEEIALEDISTGASADIEKATMLARRMVQQFGMSEKLGLVRYGEFEDNEYLGYAYNASKDYSDSTALLIDEEIRSIITSCYATSKKILSDNRNKLDELAKLLLEKEVVTKEDFMKLVLA